MIRQTPLLQPPIKHQMLQHQSVLLHPHQQQVIRNLPLRKYAWRFESDHSLVPKYLSYSNLIAGPDLNPITKTKQQINDEMKKETIIVIVVVLIIFSFLMALVIRLYCKRKSRYRLLRELVQKHEDGELSWGRLWRWEKQ